MANVLLTNKCVRNCPYCFAGKEMSQSSSKDYLSWENAIYLADFLRTSGQRRVSLLGGEPTLHPQFVDILLYFVERGFNVVVFTSGIMSKSKLDELKRHVAEPAVDRITFVCNLNNPEQTQAPKSESERVHAFLEALGPWTMPGFTIYRSDFELGFLFDLVNRYGMRKKLRLGIAHPIPGVENESIRIEEIGQVIERICSYKSDFDASRVKLSFDCGFPLCRVTDEQLGWLTRLSGPMDFKCGPAIDITPDMQVYGCFPLATVNRKSVFEFDSYQQIVDFYKKQQGEIRSGRAGIYDECDGCVHQSDGMCAGGGACQLVSRFADDLPRKVWHIKDDRSQACLSE